jgi:peptide/nickel transport system substrate-binding protein
VAKAEPAMMECKVGCLMSPDPNPKRGGEVKTAWGATTKHYDIHQGGAPHILTSFYNKLIGLDPTRGLAEITPELATSWDIASDGMSFTFDLREGVKFHDGSDFNADDVVATFDRIIFPEKYEGMISTSKSLFDAIDAVEKVDDFTVKFTLKEPRVWQFDLFSSTGAVVYPSDFLEANNYDIRTVIAPGTGPFKFVKENKEEFWQFEANANYWNPELPYVDAVKMQHVPSWTDRGTAVLTGNADFSWNVSVDTWEEGSARDDISNALLPSFGSLDVRWNNAKAPFDDIKVRRAIHLAMNRHDASAVYREEVQLVTRWMGKGAEGAMSDEELFQLPGYRKDNSEDIAEAQRLLAEAGYPNGEGLRTFNLVSAAVPGHSEVLAPFFQNQLKTNLGIDIKISVVERALLVEEFKKDFDFVQTGTSAAPIANPTPMWHLNWGTGGSQNHAKYSNPEFDAILKQLDAELDPAKREMLFRQAEDLLDANPPQYNYGFTAHSPMWNNVVKGLRLDERVAAEWGRFETVWLDR